ncbi:hypothetical protein [Xanthomonas phage SB3]|uniref:Uncharacterized protein n=1 Tax=Xanthomonas phage SB3 TaxID=3117472 RepID=A0ABZ2GUJ3_9CAUD
MQLIKYSVKLIAQNGRVINEENVTFIDSTTVKQVKAALAEQYQRSPDNIIVQEIARTAV